MGVDFSCTVALCLIQRELQNIMIYYTVLQYHVVALYWKYSLLQSVMSLLNNKLRIRTCLVKMYCIHVNVYKCIADVRLLARLAKPLSRKSDETPHTAPMMQINSVRLSMNAT